MVPQNASKPTNLKVLSGRVTADNLLKIAEKAFASAGYAATSTESIIQAAGVTKGALYHHFSSKRLLFEAVYRSVEEQMANRIDRVSRASATPWDQLLNGCFAYIDSAADTGWQRILRIDGPAVLGMETWTAIDKAYGVDRLLPFLRHLKAANVLNVASVDAFAWQLTGAMNQATFWISGHDDPQKAIFESKQTLAHLLEAVRGPQSRPGRS